jgi:pimeloyl-ACP methyl ester carboxylesterase
MLVHGAGGSHLDWPPTLRQLDGRRVCAVDLPGHGLSAGHGRQTIDGYAEWLEELTRLVLDGPFFVVGHSMGAAVALHLARLIPRQIIGLALIGAGARLRVSPGILNGILADREATIERLIGWAYGENLPQSARLVGRERLMRVEPIVLRDDFLACRAFDATAWAGEVHVPALLIHGSNDRMAPMTEAQQLESLLPQSELAVFEGAGHMVTFERPAEVAGAILRFTAGLESTTL